MRVIFIKFVTLGGSRKVEQQIVQTRIAGKYRHDWELCFIIDTNSFGTKVIANEIVERFPL